MAQGPSRLFPAASEGQPILSRVVHQGIEYPGEVILAQRWEPRWGLPLEGEVFFRIIFLKERPKGVDLVLQDSRTAVCLPKGAPGKTLTSLERELKALRDARGRYLTARDVATLQLQHSLGEQEEALERRLLLEETQAFLGGQVVTGWGGFTLESVSPELNPERWVQQVGQELLAHRYPSLPLGTPRFPYPLSPRHVPLLFEALFSSSPSPEAMRTLEAFGPGLGLQPPGFLGCQALEFIRQEFTRRERRVSAAGLLQSLTHQQGIPRYLATLYLLTAVYRNLPAMELALKEHHSLTTHNGEPMPGDRLTWDLLPELAWVDTLADSFDLLRESTPPTWRTTLPYALALVSSLSAHPEPDEVESQQTLFEDSLKDIAQRVAQARTGLFQLSKVFEQPVSPAFPQGLDFLGEVSGAPDTAAFYRACLKGGGGPSSLHQAVENLQRVERLLEASGSLLHVKSYLGGVTLPEEAGELHIQRAALMAQLDLHALLTDPRLWERLWAAFQPFQASYAGLYSHHHASYQQEAQALQRQVDQAFPLVEALERLNSLHELGPAVMSELPVRFQHVPHLFKLCSLPQAELLLAQSPVCPACHLTLQDKVPRREIESLLEDLHRALGEQHRRLSARVVKEVLALPGAELVDKFIKVLQAGDLSALPNVLNDQVMQFLRQLLRQR